MAALKATPSRTMSNALARDAIANGTLQVMKISRAPMLFPTGISQTIAPQSWLVL